MLISSHDLEGIDAILDRVVILHRGQILFEGPRSDLQNIMGDGERIEARGDGAAPSSWGRMLSSRRSSSMRMAGERGSVAPPMHAAPSSIIWHGQHL